MIRPMRRGRVSVGALLAALVLTGCGSVSEEYEIAGIDELEIPTPSPDPDDFVARIDNPWLPYAAGSSWSYRATRGTSTRYTENVTVEPDPQEVGGVTATVVQTLWNTTPPGTPVQTIDYYAQDRAGNVWWFGRDGVWEAGVDGAEAGLAMPADPRLGDGWRLALLDGVVEDRVTVDSVTDGQVILRAESDLEPGVVVQRTYDNGVGLVRTFNLEGPPGSSALTSGP